MAKKKKKNRRGYKPWSELTPEEHAARVDRMKKTKAKNKMRREAKEREAAEKVGLVTGYQELPISEKDIIQDYNYLSRLPISEERRDWIEHTMYELRERANKYEKTLYKVLKEKGVEFIHQAPFVLDGKIFFADFYIPALRTLIEVDGESHENVRAQRKDYLRDDSFASYKMNTVRIQNNVIKNRDKLEEVLAMILFNKNRHQNTERCLK